MASREKQDPVATVEDKWDGTDIEPCHPRNTVQKTDWNDLDEDYVRQYSEGDRFA
jgi:hypothetical protein